MIWRLFKRSSTHKLRHLLCHGFERSGAAYRRSDLDDNPVSSIPGLVARFPNSYVHTLKGQLWCRLHATLGEGGDRIMMDMLTDCAIFQPVDGKLGNYYQLSGPPISELEPTRVPTNTGLDTALAEAASKQTLCSKNGDRTPCQIAFVRNRMFYAKPALNAKGGIRFGMRHIRRWLRKRTALFTTNVFGRCFEPVSQPSRKAADRSYHEIYVSPTIWTTQCLHIENRPA